jgi:hypothetical protein
MNSVTLSATPGVTASGAPHAAMIASAATVELRIAQATRGWANTKLCVMLHLFGGSAGVVLLGRAGR